MKYLLLIFCVASLGYTETVLPSSVEVVDVSDHYWRDYTGLISTDALQGGVNAKGEALYIGQVVLRHRANWDFLPVSVINRSLKVQAAYWARAEDITYLSRIKVLCTKNARNYHWFDSKAVVSPKCSYVVGGREDGSPLYIGRATAEEKDIVICKWFADNRFKDCIAPYDDEESFYPEYQLLVYCDMGINDV